ncbi:MAG: VWA domain-containing protein [Phycisphaerales bacterium]|nr:VWA domain-containing protein [Phycisphaerales bacterium]
MMRFGEPSWLDWLWALAPMGALAAWSSMRMARGMRTFVAPPVLERMAPGRSVFRVVLRRVLVIAALGAIVFGLARPIGNPKVRGVQPVGRDVCFVVDVSKSMLAGDLAPNRLERAKLWVRDALRVIKGDRVALVAFAGLPSVQVPLTHDYAYFALMLNDLSPKSAPRGGTNLGDAVRAAMGEVFDEGQAGGFRDIVLITDGEDLESSFPVQAAEAAGQAGVRLIVIGIGSERGTVLQMRNEQGRLEPVKDAQGEAVVTRLDATTLRDMARMTPGGRFYQVGTGDIRLDEVYESLITEASQRQFEDAQATVYEEYFQVCMGLALVLLSVELVIGERRWRR